MLRCALNPPECKTTIDSFASTHNSQCSTDVYYLPQWLWMGLPKNEKKLIVRAFPHLSMLYQAIQITEQAKATEVLVISSKSLNRSNLH